MSEYGDSQLRDRDRRICVRILLQPNEYRDSQLSNRDRRWCVLLLLRPNEHYYAKATPPTVGNYLFDRCSKLETIYVPVGAVEAYNVAPWNAYNIVELIPNYEPRHNGTKTYNGRDVIAVKLTGEYSGEQVYTLTSAERNKDYTDVTASVVFQVEPGEELTPKVEQLSNWMHHAVYIDTDKNGFTGAIAAGSEWKPAGDLVSYSFYNNGAASDESGWNSIGDVITGEDRSNPPLPAFTAPTEPGIYCMRFVQD